MLLQRPTMRADDPGTESPPPSPPQHPPLGSPQGRPTGHLPTYSSTARAHSDSIQIPSRPSACSKNDRPVHRRNGTLSGRDSRERGLSSAGWSGAGPIIVFIPTANCMDRPHDVWERERIERRAKGRSVLPTHESVELHSRRKHREIGVSPDVRSRTEPGYQSNRL